MPYWLYFPIQTKIIFQIYKQYVLCHLVVILLIMVPWHVKENLDKINGYCARDKHPNDCVNSKSLQTEHII